MKILLICYVYPPEVAPAGVMIRELAEDLTAAGHDVTVLTGWPSHPLGVLYQGWRKRFRQVEHDPAGFRVIRCGHALGPRFRMAWRLWHYLTFALSSFVNGLASGPIDAAYNDSTPLFGKWSSWLLARCKGARSIYAIQDLHPESAHRAGLIDKGVVYKIYHTLDTWLCKVSDVVVTLSGPMRDLVRARGVDPGKIRILPLWLDPRTVSPRDRDNPWRRAQGIGPETFVVMYAGTIGYISGAEVLIDAAGILGGRRDILFLVVGEGPVKDEMEVRAKELGLPNVRFLPFQPADVLADMQAAADADVVTLLPETGETSVPSKVLGYMAAGRPVIASVHPESPTGRVIREADCGVLAACQDPQALAEAVCALAGAPERARQMGRNAYAYFQEHFSRAKCTRRYEAVITGRADPAGTDAMELNRQPSKRRNRP